MNLECFTIYSVCFLKTFFKIMKDEIKSCTKSGENKQSQILVYTAKAAVLTIIF